MNRVRFPKRIINLSARMSLKTLPLDKKLQLGGFLVSLVMAGFAIYQYGDTKEREFKKLFYEERFRTYIELSETVAKLATLPPKSKERTEAVQRYWQLVFGKSHLVGDAEVQEAIRKTSNWVVFCVEEKAQPHDKDLCIDVAGNGYAIWVSVAARNSIIRTWNVPLEKLNKNDLYPKPHGYPGGQEGRSAEKRGSAPLTFTLGILKTESFLSEKNYIAIYSFSGITFYNIGDWQYCSSYCNSKFSSHLA